MLIAGDVDQLLSKLGSTPMFAQHRSWHFDIEQVRLEARGERSWSGHLVKLHAVVSKGEALERAFDGAGLARGQNGFLGIAMMDGAHGANVAIATAGMVEARIQGHANDAGMNQKWAKVASPGMVAAAGGRADGQVVGFTMIPSAHLGGKGRALIKLEGAR